MTLALSDQKLWPLVLALDAAWDGRFVYAVATTRIYCRPSCPARRPRRANVRFFATVAAADRAGYRACKRCRPASVRWGRITETVLAAGTFLEERWEESPTLADLATALDVSPGHLHKQFKECTGMSPREYGASVRLTRFRGLVRSGWDVTTATYAAGSGSSRGLYAAERTTLGMTPSQYARRGPGQQISYGLYASALGRVLSRQPSMVSARSFLGSETKSWSAGSRKSSSVRHSCACEVGHPPG